MPLLSIANPPLAASTKRKISLTLNASQMATQVVHLRVSDLIAYSQDRNFTRLHLTGNKVLEVKETTDQIDRLVRAATSQDDQMPALTTGGRTATPPLRR